MELQTDQRATFYSAEEVSEHEEELVPETPKTAKKPPKEPKPKRNTNAALAAQLSEVAGLLPDLMEQVTQLRKNQEEMRQQFAAPQLPVPPRGSQMPVSGQLHSFAKMVGIPPKTKQTDLRAPPPKPAARHMQPGGDTGLTAQEEAEENSPGGDALARAMLEQSRALSVLVAQMQQADPLLDQAASSAGTSLGSKGALGREKLQQELSTRTGGFYMSVLQNALRRMKPASRLPSTLEEVPLDFSMVTYLERFGGYGGSRDLGLVQFNLAHMFDAALNQDYDGMKEHLALLMVSVEQAVQDNNRWELAYQLCLLEEPPTQIWQSRGGHSHRVRAFAPLCPQRWATACCLGLHQRGRLHPDQKAGTGKETSSSCANPEGPAWTEEEAEVPKSKARSKRRGRMNGPKSGKSPLSCCSSSVRVTTPNTGDAANDDRGLSWREETVLADGRVDDSCLNTATTRHTCADEFDSSQETDDDAVTKAIVPFTRWVHLHVRRMLAAKAPFSYFLLKTISNCRGGRFAASTALFPL